jgi:cytidylate kinase
MTIDGPPASGKTTMAKLVSEKLGLTHLDSGSIFRSLTLHCLNKGVKLTNAKEVVEKFGDADIQVSGSRIFLNGKDVSEKIRTPEVTREIVKISNIPEVRLFVKNFQHTYAAAGNGIVADGRKVGTEVFPNANFKFYLTADQEVRAKRRYLQVLQNHNVDFEDVLRDLKAREDVELAHGILLVPENAIVIDNSAMTVEETLEKILSTVQQ